MGLNPPAFQAGSFQLAVVLPCLAMEYRTGQLYRVFTPFYEESQSKTSVRPYILLHIYPHNPDRDESMINDNGLQ